MIVFVKSVPLLFTWSQIFEYKILDYCSLNLVLYFFPLSKITHIMVIINLFRYFLHNLEYFMIIMCMMILSNLFRYFLYYLVYSKQNCAFQICSATLDRI